MYILDRFYKQHLIDIHHFYVEQAQERLLSQFDKVEEEADAFGTRLIEHNKSHCGDYASLCESAHDASIDLGLKLLEMASQTRLSVCAGMYFSWDKAV